MNKAVFNYHCFEEMIERYNPFGFKKDNGVIMMFEDYSAAYYYALQKLGTDFKKGVIDVPLYISDRTGLPISEAEHIFDDMKSLLGKEELLDIDLRTFDGAERRLRDFIKALHTISETKFDEVAFQDAYAKFKQFMELLWLKEEIKDESSEGNQG